MDKFFNDINFIFYIPGSMGSLLSVLLRSQTEKDFLFEQFADDTAHFYNKDFYNKDVFQNTHDLKDYRLFLQKNISLKQHLELNLANNNSLIQRCGIWWLDEFFKLKNCNKILCYIDNYTLKLYNYYKKLREPVLISIKNDTKYNFKIKDTHKDFETIGFIKSLNWLTKFEKKYFQQMTTINMLPILQKDYKELTKICTIKNTNLLDLIINNYNKNNTYDPNVLSEKMKNYCKKYHDTV